MTTPPPRTARPWLALLIGVAIVVAVLLVLQALDTGEPAGSGGDPVRLEQPSQPPADLPAPSSDERPEQSAQQSLEGRVRPADDVAQAGAGQDGLVVIFGRVQDGLGKPVPDAEVNLNDDMGEYLDSALTEDDGSFVIEWDEPLLAGWNLGTEPDPAADPEQPGQLGPASYVHPTDLLPGDDPVECLLVLAPAPRIEGVVLDGDTGEPVEFADVELVSMSGGWVDEFLDTFSDEDGRFGLSLVSLPATGVLLRVLDDDDRVAMIGPLDLAPGESRWLEVRLADPRTINGRLLDARTGAPLENGEVQVLPLHESFDEGESWDLSYEDGSFSIEFVQNPPEYTWIYAEAEDHTPALVQLPSGSDKLDVRLGPPAVLRGRLTVGSGEDAVPVEDALVRVLLRGPGGWLVEDYEDSTFTGEEGRYELEFELVPPNAAELLIESDQTVRLRRTLSELTSIGLGGATTLDLTLRPAPDF